MKGLCFSGGGIKAASHIGALKAFEEERIRFDCVSGASSGSIIATMEKCFEIDRRFNLSEKNCN